ncbi:MAG: GtrA family protein, partial [Christensenellaceae bacterium]|nr:GtrA family protein [Christensenellaceae bacterium]
LKPYMHNELGQASDLLILIAQIVQWVLSVLFAFAVNKKYVFRDRNKGFRVVTRQLLLFSSSRFVTLVLETLIIYGCMWLFAKIALQSVWLFTHENIAKLIAAVFVIISNFFISKFLVFTRKSKTA